MDRENIGTIVFIAVLLVIVAFAVRGSIRHMRGEGGCCGGGSVRAKPKKLTEPVVEKKVVSVSGMHCENCQNHLTELLNELDGVSAKVSLKKQNAVVLAIRPVSDEELEETVRRAGYHVESIQSEAL